MHIRAFSGVRYSDTQGRPGELAAPPYDQINDQRRDEFHQTPHQFVHLSRPVASGSQGAHQHAAELHRQWLASGVLTRDNAPSLYAYAIELPSGGERLGLCALIGIEDEDSTVIQPHEETVEKTVAERLDLLRTMHVDLEPILLLSDDGGVLDRLLSTDCAGTASVARHEDEFGNVHRLHRVFDPIRLEAYIAALGSCLGPIADGHHRYKTSRILARELGVDHTTNAGCKLGVITSLSSSALTIEPIHRALLEAPQVEILRRAVLASRKVTPANGLDFAAEVDRAPQPALGVWVQGEEPEIWQLDPALGPSELPAAASQLAVVLLHKTYLPRVDLGGAAATDGTILYRSDPEELFAATRDGELAVSFWLPSMSPELFAGAISNGDLLPPKSTRFMPKVVSGLVWAEHEEDG